jgi:hypothetical protein
MAVKFVSGVHRNKTSPLLTGHRQSMEIPNLLQGLSSALRIGLSFIKCLLLSVCIEMDIFEVFAYLE